MFADMIRNATTEHEIYFLLTSYLEAVRYSDKLHCCVPEQVVRLPLNGRQDVQERFERLMIELDCASKRLDNRSCKSIKEGVHILSAALSHLSTFDVPQYVAQSLAAASALEARAA
jgi:hypothetical protein